MCIFISLKDVKLTTMDNLKSLVISSYMVIHGYNTIEFDWAYIAFVLGKCTIFLIQEHRLSREQLSNLASISSNIANAGISYVQFA